MAKLPRHHCTWKHHNSILVFMGTIHLLAELQTRRCFFPLRVDTNKQGRCLSRLAHNCIPQTLSSLIFYFQSLSQRSCPYTKYISFKTDDHQHSCDGNKSNWAVSTHHLEGPRLNHLCFSWTYFWKYLASYPEVFSRRQSASRPVTTCTGMSHCKKLGERRTAQTRHRRTVTAAHQNKGTTIQ